MWLVREQWDVVLCDVTCERKQRCNSVFWLMRGQRYVVICDVCSLTSHITKNYITLSSHKSHHKELHLFVLSQVTSQRTTSLCPLTSHITKTTSLCPLTSHIKELHLFVLSQVTSQITISLYPLTSHITKNLSLCPLTSHIKELHVWCDLWEDKEI
jgi:hypothetical protein